MRVQRLWLELNPSAKAAWQTLLRQSGLIPDAQVDYVVGIYEQERLIATGSTYQNIIKLVAVADTAQHQNLLATITTALWERLTSTGYEQAYVYTKPCTAPYFQALGFKSIAATAHVTLLERGYPDLAAYQEKLRQKKQPSHQAGAVVMNANPFTNGHRYLVQTALKSCDVVYVLVVSEDRSTFDTATRLTMVQQGLADESRVVVLPTDHYLVANTTFPSYFLKDQADLAVAAEQARLDAQLFLTRIAPVLAIKQRFVGEEPNSPVTALYNQQMAATFAGRLQLTVLPRLRVDSRVVSATTVRQAIRTGDWPRVRALVPPTTEQIIRSVYHDK